MASPLVPTVRRRHGRREYALEFGDIWNYFAAPVGIDRHPVDVNDDNEARWLLASVLPDTGRLHRAWLAIEEARHTRPELILGDAVDAVSEVVLGLPADVVPVVVTTWALAYLSDRRRTEFREALAAASRTRPIAWVSAEGLGVVDCFADIAVPSNAHGTDASILGLVVFRDGVAAPEHLGFVHPHGSWIDWRA